MIISVFPYIENESVRRLTGDVLSELDRLKCHVYVTKECAGQLPGHHVVYSKPDKMMEDCDLAIAIGGDGTTLRIAKKAAFYDKCVLGINGGRLGFMSGLEANELSLLGNVVTGKYKVDKRMMLQADIIREIRRQRLFTV